ncbi:MAG: DNA primase [Pseudomonadota bacterium]
MPGRITQKFIDDLLDRVDIVETIDRRVKLKKAGKNYSACCPFHDEKTPSFTVNSDKQFYYCFGCGASGNALGFVMEYENVEFPEAVERLASTVGMTVEREPSRDGRPGEPPRQDSNKPLYALLEQASRFYQLQLREHPQAKRAVAYLKGRGMTGVTAKQFDLGFAPPGWDNLLQALGDSDEAKQRLETAGMLVRNDAGRVYDRFRDRVVFPIRDQRGRIIGFGGRVLGDDKPKYLNSPETPVFQKGRELYGLYQAKQANRNLERILVVEGYMDVIALAQHGISNATATLGTSTSKTHLERIYRLCSEVVFCFDGDEAGRKAAFRALEAALPCMEDGRQARFLFLPEGDDPDTIVQRGGAELFNSLLADAQALESFLFDSLSANLDLDSLDGRARLSKLALPYLRQLPAGVFQELMFKELAERTGLELESLKRLEANTAPAAPEPILPPDGPEPGQPEQAEPSQPRKRHAKSSAAGYANLAQSALALLLHQPDIARLVDPSVLHSLKGDDIELLREMLTLLRLRPESNTAMLLGHWYGTPQGELLGRLAGQERLIPAGGIEQQFLDTLQALESLTHRSALEAKVDKLKSTNYAQLSALEKQQLRDALQRDAERKKR